MTAKKHPSANDDAETLKKRVTALEDFRNVGLLYGIVLGGVLILVAVFFAIQNRQLGKQLTSLAETLDGASGTLAQAQRISSDAAVRSDSSVEKFDKLETMVGQAIAAAGEAAQAANAALEASDQAVLATTDIRAQMDKADQVAADAMQEALTAKTVADKNYARLRNAAPGGMTVASGVKQGGEVDVFVDGTNIKIWFREGPARTHEVRIEESNFADVVLIPAGATATIRGSCDSCEFRVERKLKGRIENEVSGSKNLFIEK